MVPLHHTSLLSPKLTILAVLTMSMSTAKTTCTDTCLSCKCCHIPSIYCACNKHSSASTAHTQAGPPDLHVAVRVHTTAPTIHLVRTRSLNLCKERPGRHSGIVTVLGTA